MATCNIKKYDKLPARVGWKDVDYLRFRLHMNLREYKIIIKNLEEARKEWNKKSKKKN